MLILGRRSKRKYKDHNTVVISYSNSGVRIHKCFSVDNCSYSYFTPLQSELFTSSELYDLRSELINEGYTLDWQLYQRLLLQFNLS